MAGRPADADASRDLDALGRFWLLRDGWYAWVRVRFVGADHGLAGSAAKQAGKAVASKAGGAERKGKK